MASVRDILARKGDRIATVPATASVLDATLRMINEKIGSLLVMENDRVAGIITERDVLRRIVAERRDPAATTVSDVMTRDVLYCDDDTAVEEAARILRDRRIRHLPVRGGDRLIGIISIGDINAHHASETEQQIHVLHDFIYAQTTS